MKVSRFRSLFSVCLLATCFGLSAPAILAALVVQVGQNFTGATLGVDSQAQPADANGAVGPEHFAELINGRYSVFDKGNGRRVQTMTDLAFWKNAGIAFSANLAVTDPRIVFDSDSRRWFAAGVDFDPSNQVSNRFLVAVTAGADPTGTWHGFGFLADPVSRGLADFPTLGVDSRGVYLSAEVFSSPGASLGPILVSIPKAGLLATPATITGRTSFGILSDNPRGYVLQPSVAQGFTSSSEAILAVGHLGIDFQSHSTLVAFEVQNAAGPGKATRTSPRTIAIPAYTVPINPPQPDGTDNLDNGDARIGATVYRVGDVLYAVHAVGVDDRAALQWFKINATNRVVIQTGTITDPDLDLFFPSIAANAAGTVVIGCNGCSPTTFVSSFAVVGEIVGGALTFGERRLLKAGTASYQNPYGPYNTSRWGDYSATSVDPADPNRFWTIQMYASGPHTWSTQITELITSQLRLSLTLVGPNVQIAWPSAAAEYQLESTPSLSPTAAWTAVSEPPTIINNHSTVTLPALDTHRLFRLTKP